MTSVAWHHAQAIDRADLHQGRRLHAANVQPPGPAERRHNGQRHHRHKGKPDAGAEAVSYSVHGRESTDVSGILRSKSCNREFAAQQVSRSASAHR